MSSYLFPLLAATNYASLDLVTLASFYWNVLCVITVNTAIKRFLDEVERKGLDVST